MTLATLAICDKKTMSPSESSWTDLGAQLSRSEILIEVMMHSMLFALRPGKFVDSLCKKSPSNMDELRERANDYIKMEEMSQF